MLDKEIAELRRHLRPDRIALAALTMGAALAGAKAVFAFPSGGVLSPLDAAGAGTPCT